MEPCTDVLLSYFAMFFIPQIVPIIKTISVMTGMETLKTLLVLIIGVPVNTLTAALLFRITDYLFSKRLPRGESVELVDLQYESQSNDQTQNIMDTEEPAKDTDTRVLLVENGSNQEMQVQVAIEEEKGTTVGVPFTIYEIISLTIFIISFISVLISIPAQNENYKSISIQINLFFSLVLIFYISRLLQYKINTMYGIHISLVINPILVGTLLEMLWIYVIGLMTNKAFYDTIGLLNSGTAFTFTNPSGKVGDFYGYLLNVTVICLVFPVLSRMDIIVKNPVQILITCLSISFFSMVITSLVCKAISLPFLVSSGLVFRAVTTPIAILNTKVIDGNLGIAGAASIFAGIVGSMIWKLFRLKSGLELGLSLAFCSV
ncbi:hypothetical protein HDV04_006225 [Boothiomyces sp. JEL0838]|nr:hypothetical protein HDV04_006225 [Boothiomyces sp. JEL0838]